MNEPSDDLEARLRRSLASRDPGPAPASLRRRVAAISREPAAPRSMWALLPSGARPAVALIATGAAVGLGVVIAATVVRPVAAPSATGGPGVGGPAPAPDLAVTADPLALPLPLVIWGLLLALLALWVAVETYVARSAPTTRIRLPRRRSRRGLLVAALAGLVLLGGQIVRYDASLVAGGFYQASLVHLAGMGPVQGTIGEHEAAWYHYVPGTTITVVQTVRNSGSVPITVTGTNGANGGIELRLFAVHDPTGPIDVDAMPAYPFQPFELAAGTEREVIVVLHLAACPGVPVPSVEPSPDLSGSFEPPIPYASLNFATLGLTYSVLGFEREADVPFFATVVVDSPTGSVCDLDQDWASPSPSPR